LVEEESNQRPPTPGCVSALARRSVHVSVIRAPPLEHDRRKWEGKGAVRLAVRVGAGGKGHERVAREGPPRSAVLPRCSDGRGPCIPSCVSLSVVIGDSFARHLSIVLADRRAEFTRSFTLSYRARYWVSWMIGRS